MKVTVRLFATLARDYARRQAAEIRESFSAGKPFEVEVKEGCTIADLIARLGLPIELTKLSFVNGISQEKNYCLKEGDEVGFFPPIAGG